MILRTFSRLSRLRSRFDFQKVYKRHKRLHSEYFQLCYHYSNQDQARLGVVISKRNVKRAVKRNGIRRIVKEHFRHQQENLSGLDIVVIAKKPAESAQKAPLHTCIETLFAKLADTSTKR